MNTFNGEVKEIVQERPLNAEVQARISALFERFSSRRSELLDARVARRRSLSEGRIELLPDTVNIRASEWKVDPVPEHLLERRVELIGGATRSELINGLNAGAKSYIADLWNFNAQDSWSILRAHKYLQGAANRTLVFLDPQEGRVRVNPRSPTRLMMAPRSLYLSEAAVSSNGEPVPAGLFDLALYMIKCATALIEHQGGVDIYLRDVQGHLEARLWVRLIEALEEELDLERGTVRVTVMLDTIAGALEADEILFELSHHAAGLSLDPQGYTADLIALFHSPEKAVLPDRETIGLNAPFLRALSLITIGVCHRRGCHAMGAPSLVLPSLNLDTIKSEYLEMLADKEREAVDGHDGTLVVHEDMVNASMVEFNKSMPRAHQMNYLREDAIEPSQLVAVPVGSITVESVKGCLRTLLRSLLSETGKGWVIQGGRVHDRSSILLGLRLLWHWNHHPKGAISATNMPLNIDLIKFMLRKEADKMFDMQDPLVKKRVDQVMTYIMDQVNEETVPMG